jgi:hypothetical protein
MSSMSTHLSTTNDPLPANAANVPNALRGTHYQTHAQTTTKQRCRCSDPLTSIEMWLIGTALDRWQMLQVRLRVTRHTGTQLVRGLVVTCALPSIQEPMTLALVEAVSGCHSRRRS